MAYIAWFEEIKSLDAAVVGGKGANLGEMLGAGLPVPAGFVITTPAFRTFLAETSLSAEIESKLRDLSAADPAAIRQAAGALERRVQQAPMPARVAEAIVAAYAELPRRGPEGQSTQHEVPVAIRSSAPVEDTAAYSFAGMFRSYLNVRGQEELLRRVQDCWASLFGARVLAYRARQGFAGMPEMAVVVQRMVDAQKSGVMFTVDPTSGQADREVIEAAWGLGELVVGGQVQPDRFVVDKKTLEIRERAIACKAAELVRLPETGELIQRAVGPDRIDSACLSDEEVRAVAELGRRDEEHYQRAQDVEFAIEDGHVYLVQTRPVTTHLAAATPAPGPRALKALIRGLKASPGKASGPVRLLRSPAEGEALQPGEILVAPMTTPDWVPFMRRAAAIVTETGGMTSHAAIVSRELGIPCIVGASGAMKALANGTQVTVNASEGTVYEGAAPEAAPRTVVVSGPSEGPGPIVTATRLYVNLGEPAQAEAVSRLPVDGVGLLRAEFMILEALEGKHPRLLLEQAQSESFTRKLAEGMRTIAAAFQPRPVVYRSMDFRTNEFRGLDGGERFEPAEANPMIGYRGCFRYTREPDLFAVELEAMTRVRTEFDNLHLMIPFVRTAREFEACKRLIDDSDLMDSRHFKLWVMAEVPSVMHWIPRYAELGVSGVSIGSNDLTGLMLGIDRDNAALSELFDERDPAVLAAIENIIRASHAAGLTCSICGQAPSVYADYAECLIGWGIDSISVSPDAVASTRKNMAAAEQRILLAAARRRSGPNAV